MKRFLVIFLCASTVLARTNAPLPSYPVTELGTNYIGGYKDFSAATVVGLTSALTNRPPRNVKDYGAIGSGSVDDTAAIQRALNAQPNGTMLWFPSGTYIVTSSLQNSNAVSMTGDGPVTAQIVTTSPTQDVLIVNTTSGVTIKDLYFGSTTNRTGGAYIRVLPGSGINTDTHITRLILVDAYIGVNFVSAGLFTVNACHFEGYANAGIRVDNITNAQEGDSGISDNIFSGGTNLSAGVLQVSAGGLRCEHNKFLTGGYGYRGTFDASTSDLFLIGNSFEQAAIAAISIESVSNANFAGPVIADNEFYCNVIGSKGIILTDPGYPYLDTAIIGGNIFGLDSFTTGLVVNTGSRIDIMPNSFNGVLTNTTNAVAILSSGTNIQSVICYPQAMNSIVTQYTGNFSKWTFTVQDGSQAGGIAVTNNLTNTVVLVATAVNQNSPVTLAQLNAAGVGVGLSASQSNTIGSVNQSSNNWNTATNLAGTAIQPASTNKFADTNFVISTSNTLGVALMASNALLRTGSQAVTNGLMTAAGATNNYLVYRAMLTQTGLAAPVAIVLENSLGGTVVWSRTAAGSYSGTLTGAFPTAKTSLLIGPTPNVNETSLTFADDFVVVDTNTVAVHTFDTDFTGGSSQLDDNALSNTTVSIMVCPFANCIGGGSGTITNVSVGAVGITNATSQTTSNFPMTIGSTLWTNTTFQRVEVQFINNLNIGFGVCGLITNLTTGDRAFESSTAGVAMALTNSAWLELGASNVIKCLDISPGGVNAGSVTIAGATAYRKTLP